MIEPIEKSLLVQVTPERAFAAFTREIAEWWPLASHSIAASTGRRATSVSIEPKKGGAIVEAIDDGETARWGVITEWDPPHRLAFTWHLRRPENEQTHVTVSFAAEGGGTRVTLVHAGWDAQGKDAAANRAQYNSGWDFVLGERYAGHVAGTDQTVASERL